MCVKYELKTVSSLSLCWFFSLSNCILFMYEFGFRICLLLGQTEDKSSSVKLGRQYSDETTHKLMQICVAWSYTEWDVNTAKQKKSAWGK